MPAKHKKEYPLTKNAEGYKMNPEPDIKLMRDLIIMRRKKEKERLGQVGNWEIDQYYERFLKKRDEGRDE